MSADLSVIGVATKAVAINSEQARISSSNIAGANQPSYIKMGFDFKRAISDLASSYAVPSNEGDSLVSALSGLDYVKQLGGQINLDQEVATMNEAAGRVKVISKIISAKMALMSLAVVGGR